MQNILWMFFLSIKTIIVDFCWEQVFLCYLVIWDDFVKVIQSLSSFNLHSFSVDHYIWMNTVSIITGTKWKSTTFSRLMFLSHNLFLCVLPVLALPNVVFHVFPSHLVPSVSLFLHFYVLFLLIFCFMCSLSPDYFSTPPTPDMCFLCCNRLTCFSLSRH